MKYGWLMPRVPCYRKPSAAGALRVVTGSHYWISSPLTGRGRGSVDREVPRRQAVFEDAATAVGKVALTGKVLECRADRLGLVPRSGRHVLHKVVAEAPAGHKDRLQTAGAGNRGERIGHRPDRRVDREIGPVAGKATAGGKRIEAARPKHLVVVGRPGRAVEIDEDRVELRGLAGAELVRSVMLDRVVEIE